MGKIYDGIKYHVPKNQFSGLVSLRTMAHKLYCVGSVVTVYTVLSAAHCIRPYERKIFSYDVYVLIHNKKYDIHAMESHPRYNESGEEEFDIGLITVSER